MNNGTTLQLIFQYLSEQGYSNALQSLQEDSGVSFDCTAFEKPQRLRNILAEHHDFTQSLIGLDPSSLDEMTFEQDLVRKNTQKLLITKTNYNF